MSSEISPETPNASHVLERIVSPKALKSVTKGNIVNCLIVVDQQRNLGIFFGEPDVPDPERKLTAHQKLAMVVQNRLKEPELQASAVRMVVNQEGLIDTIVYYGEPNGEVPRETQIETLLKTIKPSLLHPEVYIDREGGYQD